MKPSVEIIIPTFNSKNNILKCLRSLEKCKYPNLKVSVVDQNSSDGTYEEIKKNLPKINLVRNPENNGFTGANNQILKKSKADYCILLNDDTEQDYKWIEELVKLAEKDDKIVLIQPKILSLKEKDKFEHAGGAGGFIDIYGYPLCRGRVFFDTEYDKGQYDRIKNIFWASGAAVLIRRNVLDKIGYLDESFFVYSEELDLSWRANVAGYKVKFCPRSIVYHLGGSTSKRNEFRRRKIFLLQRNLWITILKNTEIKNWWKIVIPKLFFELGEIMYNLKNKKVALEIFRANYWIIKNIKYLIKRNKEVEKIRKISDKELRKKMINGSIIIGYFLKNKKTFSSYINKIPNYK